MKRPVEISWEVLTYGINVNKKQICLFCRKNYSAYLNVKGQAKEHLIYKTQKKTKLYYDIIHTNGN